jgi:hypothetical protein
VVTQTDFADKRRKLSEYTPGMGSESGFRLFDSATKSVAVMGPAFELCHVSTLMLNAT